MYFNKIQNPPNFAFIPPRGLKKNRATLPGHKIALRTADLGEDVFEISYESPAWEYRSHSGLDLNAFKSPSRAELQIAPHGGFAIRSGRSNLLATLPQEAFGVCGQSWMVQFAPETGQQFYGMGEKNNGFEKSGVRTKFWNTDVWADFHADAYINGTTDPMYLSVPYLIIKKGNTYLGLLVDNPHAVYMGISPQVSIGGEQLKTELRQPFFIGSSDGTARMYVIVGPTLHDLTCKFQRLVGATPRPPLWSLGYQQCRWGYQSYQCLDNLDKNFSKHGIPCDGLWLDIDYMRGYRVFTFEQKHFSAPSAQIARIQKRGRKVVPIIDPGVKLDPGYRVYDSGLKSKAYCKTQAGKDFVGFVWPGATVFPDFASHKARAWWAGQVAQFASSSGVQGAWLDMNDPAVGASELDTMLFNGGKWDHSSYHNQYALGMAMASREGFLKAHPDKRPFLLSRSGFTGMSKYAAIWTGDNYANDHHLKNAVPMSLNLALSGIPFNGPDAGGFGGDTTPELMIAWFKMQFLFPFFRNHTHQGCRAQEPWAFGAKTLGILREYIRLRYKLLPYLYNLYIRHEQTGEAILRPLIYDFEDTGKLPIGHVGDQFMAGPAIMQAPVLSSSSDAREVTLPEAHWFSCLDAKWIRGGRKLRVKQTARTTPLYFREGGIVPMQVGERKDQKNDLGKIELHIFLRKDSKGAAACRYIFDDGESFQYRKGGESEYYIEAKVSGTKLEVKVDKLRANCGALEVSFVLYDGFKTIAVNGVDPQVHRLALKKGTHEFAGSKLPVWTAAALRF